jgi:hypothetical protein
MWDSNWNERIIAVNDLPKSKTAGNWWIERQFTNAEDVAVVSFSRWAGNSNKKELRIVDLITGETLAGRAMNNNEFLLHDRDFDNTYYVGTLDEGSSRLSIRGYQFGLDGVDIDPLTAQVREVQLPADYAIGDSVFTYQNYSFETYIPGGEGERSILVGRMSGSQKIGDTFTWVNKTIVSIINPDSTIKVIEWPDEYDARFIHWMDVAYDGGDEILFQLNVDPPPLNNVDQPLVITINTGPPQQVYLTYNIQTEAWGDDITQNDFWDAMDSMGSARDEVIRFDNKIFDLRLLAGLNDNQIADLDDNPVSILSNGNYLIELEIRDANDYEGVGYFKLVVVDKDLNLVKGYEFDGPDELGVRSVRDSDPNYIYIQNLNVTFAGDTNSLDGLSQDPTLASSLFRIKTVDVVSVLDELSKKDPNVTLTLKSVKGVEHVKDFSQAELAKLGSGSLSASELGFINTYIPTDNGSIVISAVFNFSSDQDTDENSDRFFATQFDTKGNLVQSAALEGEFYFFDVDNAFGHVFVVTEDYNNNESLIYIIDKKTGFIKEIDEDVAIQAKQIGRLDLRENLDFFDEALVTLEKSEVGINPNQKWITYTNKKSGDLVFRELTIDSPSPGNPSVLDKVTHIFDASWTLVKSVYANPVYGYTALYGNHDIFNELGEVVGFKLTTDFIYSDASKDFSQSQLYNLQGELTGYTHYNGYIFTEYDPDYNVTKITANVSKLFAEDGPVPQYGDLMQYYDYELSATETLRFNPKGELTKRMLLEQVDGVDGSWTKSIIYLDPQSNKIGGQYLDSVGYGYDYTIARVYFEDGSIREELTSYDYNDGKTYSIKYVFDTAGEVISTTTNDGFWIVHTLNGQAQEPVIDDKYKKVSEEGEDYYIFVDSDEFTYKYSLDGTFLYKSRTSDYKYEGYESKWTEFLDLKGQQIGYESENKQSSGDHQYQSSYKSLKSNYEVWFEGSLKGTVTLLNTSSSYITASSSYNQISSDTQSVQILDVDGIYTGYKLITLSEYSSMSNGSTYHSWRETAETFDLHGDSLGSLVKEWTLDADGNETIPNEYGFNYSYKIENNENQGYEEFITYDYKYKTPSQNYKTIQSNLFDDEDNNIGSTYFYEGSTYRSASFNKNFSSTPVFDSVFDENSDENSILVFDFDSDGNVDASYLNTINLDPASTYRVSISESYHFQDLTDYDDFRGQLSATLNGELIDGVSYNRYLYYYDINNTFKGYQHDDGVVVTTYDASWNQINKKLNSSFDIDSLVEVVDGDQTFYEYKANQSWYTTRFDSETLEVTGYKTNNGWGKEGTDQYWHESVNFYDENWQSNGGYFVSNHSNYRTSFVKEVEGNILTHTYTYDHYADKADLLSNTDILYNTELINEYDTSNPTHKLIKTITFDGVLDTIKSLNSETSQWDTEVLVRGWNGGSGYSQKTLNGEDYYVISLNNNNYLIDSDGGFYGRYTSHGFGEEGQPGYYLSETFYDVNWNSIGSTYHTNTYSYTGSIDRFESTWDGYLTSLFTASQTLDLAFEDYSVENISMMSINSSTNKYQYFNGDSRPDSKMKQEYGSYSNDNFSGYISANYIYTDASDNSDPVLANYYVSHGLKNPDVTTNGIRIQKTDYLNLSVNLTNNSHSETSYSSETYYDTVGRYVGSGYSNGNDIYKYYYTFNQVNNFVMNYQDKAISGTRYETIQDYFELDGAYKDYKDSISQQVYATGTWDEVFSRSATISNGQETVSGVNRINIKNVIDGSNNFDYNHASRNLNVTGYADGESVYVGKLLTNDALKDLKISEDKLSVKYDAQLDQTTVVIDADGVKGGNDFITVNLIGVDVSTSSFIKTGEFIYL